MTDIELIEQIKSLSKLASAMNNDDIYFFLNQAKVMIDFTCLKPTMPSYDLALSYLTCHLIHIKQVEENNSLLTEGKEKSRKASDVSVEFFENKQSTGIDNSPYLQLYSQIVANVCKTDINGIQIENIDPFTLLNPSKCGC